MSETQTQISKISATIAKNGARAHFGSGLAFAIIGATFFSTKAIAAKLIYRYGVDAVLVITLRMILALPFFAAVAWWQSRHATPLSRADKWRVLALGMIGYYASSFLDFLGLQFISAGLERLILFLMPSFVLLISSVLLKKSISRFQWAALAVSYVGIVLVFAHDAAQGGRSVAIGSLFVLGSAICYAVYLIGSGQWVQRIGSIRLVAYAMCVSTIACVVQFFILRPITALWAPAPVWWLSLFNATACTVVPVFLTMMAVARIGAPLTSQASMIGPVSTLALGYFILQEPITLWQLMGAALVMGGIFLLSKHKTEHAT